MLLQKMVPQEEDVVLNKTSSLTELDQREMPSPTQLFLRLITVMNLLPVKIQPSTTTTMLSLNKIPISPRPLLQQHSTMKFQLNWNSFHKLLFKLLLHQLFQNVLQKKLKKTQTLTMLLILITSQVNISGPFQSSRTNRLEFSRRLILEDCSRVGQILLTCLMSHDYHFQLKLFRCFMFHCYFLQYNTRSS